MQRLGFNRFRNSFKEFFSNFGLLFVIFIPLFFLVNFTYIYISIKSEDTLITQQRNEANEEISIIDFVIRTSITNTYNDLLVIRDSDEFSTYINNPNSTTLEVTEDLFYRIALNKESFNNITYIDSLGQEIIKIQNATTGAIVLDSSLLSDISSLDSFQSVVNLNEDEFYISNINLNQINDQEIPVIGFTTPVYTDSNVLEGYLVIEFIATDIMSIFNEYIDNSDSFISLGLLSNNILYQFYQDSDSTEYVMNIVLDFEEEFYNFDANNLITKEISIEEELANLYQADTGYLEIFAYLESETMVAERGSFLTNNYYILVIIDIFVIIIFAYIGIVIKSRNDDRVLLNANVYLSDTNKDGVLITNSNKKVTYINKTFELMFRYPLQNIIGLSPRQFLKTKIREDFDVFMNTDKLYEKILWNISKTRVYVLSYLRINTIKSLKGNIKYFIALYSYPDFNSKTILEKMPKDNVPEHFSRTIGKISEIFYIRQLNVKSSIMFLIKINFASKKYLLSSSTQYNCEICEHLRLNLDEKYIIAIPKIDHILVSIKGDLLRNSIDYYHTKIANIIDNFKYDHSQKGSLTYLITSDFVKDEKDTYEALIFNTFAAMELSKKDVTKKYLPYQSNMRDILRRDNMIREQLDNGFENDEFYLNYQVQSSLTDGSITGVEALLRWNNEKLGIIPPNDFIPIIEDSYHISLLSLMVVRKVIEDFEPYYLELPKNFRISINLTSFDFHNEVMIRDIVNLISSSLISTSNFCFEITESGYLENTEKTNEIIDFLHSKDIVIAIDDFGRGFSSLSSLKNIHADTVKVDRAFIKDYPDKDDGLMHRTIANLINTLGLKVVIEGTETKEQIELAKSTKCHEHQGYFVSKPLSFDSFFNRFIRK